MTSKIINPLLKLLLAVILLIIICLLIAFSLSAITVDRTTPLSQGRPTKTIYIHTNGVHLDIAIKKQDASIALLQNLELIQPSDYLSFGWGDENFYLETPTWTDLTPDTAVTALFLNSSTLMHVTTYYQQPQLEWIAIPVSDTEFTKLNMYLTQSFMHDNAGKKIILPNQSYGETDQFYKATGNYTILKTCNTWANDGFKRAGLKASYWTPFGLGLLSRY